MDCTSPFDVVRVYTLTTLFFSYFYNLITQNLIIPFSLHRIELKEKYKLELYIINSKRKNI